MISHLQIITIYTQDMVFTTRRAEEIETTYQELKRRGVHFTMELVRLDYGKGRRDQEARFVDRDGNEFLIHI